MSFQFDTKSICVLNSAKNMLEIHFHKIMVQFVCYIMCTVKRDTISN